LGKELFFDKRLSRNNDLSCATCHQPDKAFTDNLQFSFGDNNAIGTVNAPTLTNVGYHPYFNFNGGVVSLETQILVPIQEHNEFNTNILDIVAKLATDLTYEQLSQKAYNRPFDAFVLTRAVANFQRSLVSGNSRYDQHFLQNKPILNESELRGYDLFFSDEAKCAQCHSGFNFTSYAFENNGLYEDYENIGRMAISFDENDRAKFKIPTLRNIALTAPYMHDGSFATLEEIVEHYNSGGAAHPNKSALLQPLNLTNQQKQDLVNFLKTLTDEDFISNPFFKL
jgi:cytochrome c peroxidase